MSREALYPALVLICDAEGQPCGAGTLVSAREVLTCAHVVAAALRVVPAAEAPDAALSIRFTHVGDDAPRRAAVKPMRWFPPPQPGAPTTAQPGDLALLELRDPPPPSAQPVAGLVADTRTGAEIWAFGLPPGHQASGGGWARGTVQGEQSSGWIQVDSPLGGYRIQPGFSGAAAWSDELGAVVGVVVAAEAATDTRVGWIIPAEDVAAACPEVVVTRPAVVPLLAKEDVGPRAYPVVEVLDAPTEEPPLNASEQEQERWHALWLQSWFNRAKVVVGVGAAAGVAVGDYFDVLARREPVVIGGAVVGYVDQPGSMVRAVEVKPAYSVCQLSSFAYKSFFDYVLPARMKAAGFTELDDDEEVPGSLFGSLMAPVAAGESAILIPSEERDAHDEIEDLYSRSLDDDLDPRDRERTYKDMVRRADDFLLRFPHGYFAGPALYQRGYAQIQLQQWDEAQDTFERYLKRFPFGSVEGAEGYVEQAKAALRLG